MKFSELQEDQICQDEDCNCQDYDCNSKCNQYHPNEFCFICDEKLGDLKLYVEVHGKNGWSPELPQQEKGRDYICWACVSLLERINIDEEKEVWLIDYFKKRY